jgi:hypothetical protein
MMHFFFATVFHFFATVTHFFATPPFFTTDFFFLCTFFTLKPHNPSDSIRVVLCCFRVEIGAGGEKMAKKEGCVAKK